MNAIACLNCGFSMIQRGCKVRCPRCGIFFDCSDGMLPLYEAEAAGDHPESSARKSSADDHPSPRGA